MEFEAGRHDSNDDMAFAVHPDRLTDKSGIGAEAPLPQTMTDHGDAIGAGPILLSQKRSTQYRLHAENGKQTGGGIGSGHPLRRILSAEVEQKSPASADLLEDRVLLAPILEVRIRYPIAPAVCSRVRRPNLNEAIRLRI